MRGREGPLCPLTKPLLSFPSTQRGQVGEGASFQTRPPSIPRHPCPPRRAQLEADPGGLLSTMTNDQRPSPSHQGDKVLCASLPGRSGPHFHPLIAQGLANPSKKNQKCSFPSTLGLPPVQAASGGWIALVQPSLMETLVYS